MTGKSCAVGMRNAIQRTSLELSWNAQFWAILTNPHFLSLLILLINHCSLSVKQAPLNGSVYCRWDHNTLHLVFFSHELFLRLSSWRVFNEWNMPCIVDPRHTSDRSIIDYLSPWHLTDTANFKLCPVYNVTSNGCSFLAVIEGKHGFHILSHLLSSIMFLEGF